MNQPIYSAAGNIVMIHHLHDSSDVEYLRSSQENLETLATLGKQHNVDSVMVLTGNPQLADEQGYHVTMQVFEPHAYSKEHPDSAWSTMCGNGVRAVAQYLYDTYSQEDSFTVRTGSGEQQVQRVGDHQWQVNMGAFFHSSTELQQYVATEELTLTSLGLEQYTQQLEATPFYGFHCQPNAETIDGEPHLIFFTKEISSSEKVVALAEEIGRQIITHDFFPQEINISIASVVEEGENIRVNAATYERHIYYVTQACGTASTVIGTALFQKYPSTQAVEISMPGGVLTIDKKNDIYFLAGDACVKTS